MNFPLIDVSFFFFNDTATTEIYTLSLHDALPICGKQDVQAPRSDQGAGQAVQAPRGGDAAKRSEEHTSELQSRPHLVCRLLLEKKKKLKSNAVAYNIIFICCVMSLYCSGTYDFV